MNLNVRNLYYIIYSISNTHRFQYYSYFFVVSPPIHRLDPHHPSLTAFEIVYKWQGTAEDDASLGIYTLFILSLTFFIILYITVLNSYYEDYQKYQTSVSSTESTTTTTILSGNKIN